MAVDQEKAGVTNSLVAAGARLYYRVTEHALEHLGPEGGVAARHWVRNWMGWRGAQMRKAHQEMGLPINVQSIWSHWDSASIHAVTIEEKVNRPYDVRMDVTKCALADVWTEAGFGVWGHIFCDEAHQALADNYHPDATIVIHNNLNKGDRACTFRWAMPPQPEGTPTEPDPRVPATVIGGMPMTKDTWHDPDAVMVRGSRFMGMMIYFGIKEYTTRFGKDGEEVFRVGLRRYARDRAAALCKDHIDRNLPLNAESLVRHLDIPFVYAWERQGESISGKTYSGEVTRCPFAEVWAEQGEPSIGRMYCEEVYPALVAAYRPGSTVEMRKLKPRGDGACTFSINVAD